MKTETVKMAMYRDTRYGVSTSTAIASKYIEELPYYIRTSDYVEVEFPMISSTAEQDAIKALAVKAAQDAIDTAQAVLDKLL